MFTFTQEDENKIEKIVAKISGKTVRIITSFNLGSAA